MKMLIHNIVIHFTMTLVVDIHVQMGSISRCVKDHIRKYTNENHGRWWL